MREPSKLSSYPQHAPGNGHIVWSERMPTIVQAEVQYITFAVGAVFTPQSLFLIRTCYTEFPISSIHRQSLVHISLMGPRHRPAFYGNSAVFVPVEMNDVGHPAFATRWHRRPECSRHGNKSGKGIAALAGQSPCHHPAGRRSGHHNPVRIDCKTRRDILFYRVEISQFERLTAEITGRRIIGRPRLAF